jgi:hypothetical protein
LPNTQVFEGYGECRTDEDGIPLLSDVVRDFLEKRHVSAEDFGKQFGRLTRRNQQPYTKSRIYQMLRDNSFPKEQSRRWVLAKLLQIPPVLMGVTSLEVSDIRWLWLA